MQNSIAIIGSAGRQDDAPKVSKPLYDRMCLETLAVIDHWGIEHAVSGGAAWADHLAVTAFLDGKVKSLTLFLPAHFRNGSYVSNPRVRSDPGSTTNGYHRSFSSICRIDSLSEIEAAIRKGARVSVHEGFQTRNLEVANAVDHMLAFTFGRKSSRDLVPDDPAFGDAHAAGLKITKGTAHTWGEGWKCKLKTHVCLNEANRVLAR